MLSNFARVHGVNVIDLDDPELRAAAEHSSRLVVGGPAPVCIDEYQKAPVVLDALKARMTRDGALPGTAVLTGSTRHDALPRTAQALTGRLHTLVIRPLSHGELLGVRENFVETLLSGPGAAIAAHPASNTTRDEYVAMIVAGGFPLALNRSEAARNRWFDDYVAQSIERDAVELARIRQRQTLRDVLNRTAGQTAQILNIASLCDGLSAHRETVEAYVRLLEDLFLVERLDAWGTTLRARAQKHPKIHVVDSGLAARLLRLSAAKVAALNASVLTEFGALLETFVVNEVRKQLSWLDTPTAVGHWRTFDGAKVDLVIEADDGRVVGIEVKAGQSVASKDLQGLRTLRDELGDSFVAGVALSTGTRSYTFENRIHVCPIDRLWRTV